MRKRNYILALLMGMLSLSPAGAQEKSPLAVLLSCKGDVTIKKPSGEAIKGTFGISLMDGDVVLTGADASAELLYEDGLYVEVGPGSEVRVGKASGAPSDPSPGRTFEMVQDFIKLKDTEGTSHLAGFRGKHEEGLRLESPSQTRIRANDIVFTWNGAGAGDELRVTIESESGVHFQKDVEGTTRFEYPPEAPELVPGTSYSWAVETTDPLRFPPLRSPAAFFEVITPEDENRLQASLADISGEKHRGGSAHPLVRASIFHGFGLLDDAIAETRKAVGEDSSNRMLHAILANLYEEAGRTDEALAEYKKLAE
ncbi:MAG: tetratricopeptide repeat protein [bacterium]|nr:tetratricopeptide repeat protein [bacterium]